MALTASEKSKRYYAKNREARAAAARAYRAANPEKMAEVRERVRSKLTEEDRQRLRDYSAQWKMDNPDKRQAQRARVDRDAARASAREWKALNPEKVRDYNRRMSGVPEVRLRNRIRQAVRAAVRTGGVSSRVEKLVGWTIAELRVHLERQFVPGMGWHNIERWHIDHIVPLSSFAIKDESDPAFRRAWALANLRPLWALDNMQKSNKVLTLL